MSKKSVKSEFGKELQRLRKAKGWTQVDLSERVQLSKSYISFLESGVRHPSRDVVLRISSVLDEESGHAVSDALLVLAGFIPENPKLTRVSLTKSKNLSELGFGEFLARTLTHIRQGHFDRVERDIQNAFQRFNKPAQLQSLLAHLELARGRYEQAALLQQAALEQIDSLSPSEEKGLTPIDFILNLGVMHFLRADQLLNASSEREQREAAARVYHEALECFEKGLKLDSEHLYLLDEAGRVHFNLADISVSEALAAGHWRAAIRYFKKVLQHPEREGLPQGALFESVAFLGLAYAKDKDFFAAGLILDTLSLQEEAPALVWYILACYYSLFYRATRESALIERGIRALGRALSLEPALSSQALLDSDKDLKSLKDMAGEDLQKMIGVSVL